MGRRRLRTARDMLASQARYIRFADTIYLRHDMFRFAKRKGRNLPGANFFLKNEEDGR
jgi:hypothetical protein